VARVFSRHDGPLLIVWPDLPRLRRHHARAAFEDLQNGCDVVLGPAIDGGFYLIGIERPLPKLFSLPENAWRSPDVMTIGMAAARDAGLEIGLLRPERALHRPSDVRAALADPLLPAELARVLSKPEAVAVAGPARRKEHDGPATEQPSVRPMSAPMPSSPRAAPRSKDG
jgi:hypothetical protein